MSGNDVQQLAGRVDTLMAEVQESAVPAVADRVEELVRTLIQMYGAGLHRIVDVLASDDDDRHALLRYLAEDELVAGLLLLHDLHPVPLEERVTAALDSVRPYLGSHAGGVDLVGVDEEGVVHLRLQGSCDGCPSSSLTVRNAIEDAIWAAAPDVAAIDVEGMVPEQPVQTLLQIQPFTPHPQAPLVETTPLVEPTRPLVEPVETTRPLVEPSPLVEPVETTRPGETTWNHVDLDVPPRSSSRVLVAGEPLLVANLDGTLVAYRDSCPTCSTPLSAGALTGDVVACAGCPTRYDVRLAGRALDGATTHLEPLPLLPEGPGWKVALPARVGA